MIQVREAALNHIPAIGSVLSEPVSSSTEDNYKCFI